MMTERQFAERALDGLTEAAVRLLAVSALQSHLEIDECPGCLRARRSYLEALADGWQLVPAVGLICPACVQANDQVADLTRALNYTEED